MLITKTIEIDMGHRVPNHKSKCRNLHGHRYEIEIGVDDKVITTKGTSDEGMVIDFGDLKEIMNEIIDDVYDHSFTMYLGDEFIETFIDLRDKGQKINFVTFPPTAEKLAEHWFKLIKPELEKKKIKIHHVMVRETPSSAATYSIK